MEENEDEIYCTEDGDCRLVKDKLELAMFLAWRREKEQGKPHRVRVLLLIEPIVFVKEKTV